METTELNFLNRIQKLYHRWLWLAAAMIIGGLTGWGVHSLLPPVYEARASFVVSVDFSMSGNLSPYNLDQAVGAIQPIFLSRELLEQVVQQAYSHQMELDVNEFYRKIRIERMGETWNLLVRDPDPNRAALLLKIWMEKGYQDLSEAHLHALRAQVLKSYSIALRNCPMFLEGESAIPVVCFKLYTSDFDGIARLQEDIQNEVKLSRGINANLVFSKPELVPFSDEPVMYLRGGMIVAGMVLGFLVGVILIQVNFERPK